MFIKMVPMEYESCFGKTIAREKCACLRKEFKMRICGINIISIATSKLITNCTGSTARYQLDVFCKQPGTIAKLYYLSDLFQI